MRPVYIIMSRIFIIMIGGTIMNNREIVAVYKRIHALAPQIPNIQHRGELLAILRFIRYCLPHRYHRELAHFPLINDPPQAEEKPNG
jgi:hypothetical protein